MRRLHHDAPLEELAQDLSGLRGLAFDKPLPVGQELVKLLPHRFGVGRAHSAFKTVLVLELGR